jgi:hypothetical protein
MTSASTSSKEEPFDPAEYLQPALVALAEVTEDSGRANFGRIRSKAPYDRLDWPELYEEGNIAATVAHGQLGSLATGGVQHHRIDTLIGDLNRAGAMVEAQDPTYTRLARLDDRKFAAVVEEVLAAAISSPHA